MKRIRQALRRVDARIDALMEGPGFGESMMWDLGVDTILYLLVAICLAGVL